MPICAACRRGLRIPYGNFLVFIDRSTPHNIADYRWIRIIVGAVLHADAAE